MKKLLLICTMILVWSLGLIISEAEAQVAYGISIVRRNSATRVVDGYSGTALDYYAGYYYDPVVRGSLYRTDMNETDLDTGYDEGYADLIPAEVYLFTTNYVEGRTYCTFSQHIVRAYYYYTAFSQWFDPFRYSTFTSNGGSSFPGFPFSYYYYQSRLIFLGATQACITIPVVPPPTPTPTPPPPTPTPTPCNPNLNGVCQQRASINVFPRVIRPKSVQSFTNQTARVQVCTQPALANRTVTLGLILRPDQRNSGGHFAVFHRPNRPLGKLDRTTGTTGTNGCFTTTYYPSHIAGVVGIDAEVIGIRGGEDVMVGFIGLVELNASENYRLIGTTDSHPIGHFGTIGSIIGLDNIAEDFNNEFFGGVIPPLEQKIAYNDISVQLGGKFDLAPRGQTIATWLNSGSHDEHRAGINCDVRSNNVDPSRHARLAQIFRERGSTGTVDERATDAPHWHLRFLGDLPPNSNSSGLRNGIEQNPSGLIEVNMAEITPHSFVEDAWEILDRGSTQAEWEVWHDRLVQAKAQGTPQLFEEIKVLELNLFVSSEYAARRRTDEQLVEDVFWSHLFRQPTQAEREYWQNYLLNLPPIIRNNRLRKIRRLLEDFESLPEFEEVVNRIVDSNIPPEPTPTPTP